MPKKIKIKPEQAIIGYMLTHGSISRTTAISHFEVYDLPHVMSRLKRKGHHFTKTGSGKYLKYTLPEVANKFKKKALNTHISHLNTNVLMPNANALQPQS